LALGGLGQLTSVGGDFQLVSTNTLEHVDHLRGD